MTGLAGTADANNRKAVVAFGRPAADRGSRSDGTFRVELPQGGRGLRRERPPMALDWLSYQGRKKHNPAEWQGYGLRDIQCPAKHKSAKKQA